MGDLFGKLDRELAKKCLYVAITALVTFGLGMLLWYSSDFFVHLWKLVCTVLGPLVYGAALCYLMSPLVRRVNEWLKRSPRLARNERARNDIAVMLSVALVIAALVLLLALVLLMVTQSISKVNFATLQELLGSAQGDFMDMVVTLQQRLNEWGIKLNGTSSLGTAVSGVADFTSTAVMSVICSVYFLLDGRRVVDYFARLLRAGFGFAVDESMVRLSQDADLVFSGYFRGQFMDALLVGCLSMVLLTIVGVPYGPVVGALTGLGNMIPYLGAPLGFCLTAVLCLAEGAWGRMLAGFAVLGIVMFVDGNILNPRLLSHTVKIHPLLVLCALIAGGAVGGLAGMLVAVPVAAFCKIQIDRWLEQREAEQARALQEAQTAEGAGPAQAANDAPQTAADASPTQVEGAVAAQAPADLPAAEASGDAPAVSEAHDVSAAEPERDAAGLRAAHFSQHDPAAQGARGEEPEGDEGSVAQ